MHICFICNEYPPAKHGGIGSFTYDLATGLLSRGWKVTVVGIYSKVILELNKDIIEHINGIRVVRLIGLTRLGVRLAHIWDRYRLTQWLHKDHRKQHYDIIEAPDYQGWTAFGIPKDIPLLVRLHGSTMYYDAELHRRSSRLTKLFEKKSLTMADALVSVSKYTAKKTLPLCKQSDRDYRVIYNSVDAKKFAPSKEILQEEGHILFVGSVIPKKGIEQLILAMNIVSARYSYARLTVVGKTDYRLASGQLYKDYLLSLLNEEIANRVIFVGSVDRNTELLNYLRRAHVCCYPSHSEAFAIAPLEAMSVGKATISTEAASGPEAIQDNVNGLLCNPFSPESIASKIMSVLSNPAFAAILGFNARQEILQRFNYSDWITANISHYEDVTKEFRGKHL